MRRKSKKTGIIYPISLDNPLRWTLQTANMMMHPIEAGGYKFNSTTIGYEVSAVGTELTVSAMSACVEPWVEIVYRSSSPVPPNSTTIAHPATNHFFQCLKISSSKTLGLGLKAYCTSVCCIPTDVNFLVLYRLTLGALKRCCASRASRLSCQLTHTT